MRTHTASPFFAAFRSELLAALVVAGAIESVSSYHSHFDVRKNSIIRIG
jgi:hypothetical protein